MHPLATLLCLLCSDMLVGKWRPVGSTLEQLPHTCLRTGTLGCTLASYLYALYLMVRYRPRRAGVAQRVVRGIALLFHDRGIRRWWVVSSTPRPYFTPRKDPVPISQEAGCAPGPVWTGGKSRPHWDSIPDLPARSSVAIPTELPGPRPRIDKGKK